MPRNSHARKGLFGDWERLLDCWVRPKKRPGGWTGMWRIRGIARENKHNNPPWFFVGCSSWWVAAGTGGRNRDFRVLTIIIFVLSVRIGEVVASDLDIPIAWHPLASGFFGHCWPFRGCSLCFLLSKDNVVVSQSCLLRYSVIQFRSRHRGITHQSPAGSISSITQPLLSQFPSLDPEHNPKSPLSLFPPHFLMPPGFIFFLITLFSLMLQATPAYSRMEKPYSF